MSKNIDPPYNTGNDGFVYPDSFEYSDDVLKDIFGLNEDELKRLKSIQGKSTHSAWLAFMYPRVMLMKKLLSDSGIIYISIDDNEQANLKLILDEIFGEINFVGNIAWESKTKSQNTESAFNKLQPKVEHIFVYSKNNRQRFNLLSLGNKEYQFSDERGVYREYVLETMAADGIRGRATMVFDIYGIVPPKGQQWKLGLDTINMYEGRKDIIIRDNKIIIKIRPEDERNERYLPFWAFFSKEEGTAESAKIYFNKIMNSRELFDTVKPMEVVKRLVFHASEHESIIADFFAGSGTTADAVMQLNAEDGGNRQFIMVQIDEPSYELDGGGNKIARKGSETAFNAGYMSIDEISRDRIKRASQKIRDEQGLTLPENFDGGFKHYRVVKPSQASINDLDSYDPKTGMFIDARGNALAFSESGFDDMIQPFSSEGLGVEGNATGVDSILTTWMVQDGYKFDNEIKKLSLGGYDAYYIEDSRIYLIDSQWNSDNTRDLLNKIGKYELKVQTIVLYGYSFGLENIRELEIGLKQLPTRVNLVKRY